MFGNSSENEVNMGVDVDTTMETESRPILDRVEKLRKVEEQLLSKRTNERFTNYDGVMSDDSLSLSQKIIHLEKAIDDATRKKSTALHYKENYLKNSFFNRRRFIKNFGGNEVFKTVGAIFTKIIQTCSGIQSNYILHCSFKLHSL